MAFQHLTELQINIYEHLWADIRINNNIFAINEMYRPPNESAENHQYFLNAAENILQQLSSYEKAEYKLLTGDLNYGNCYCKVPIINPKPLGQGCLHKSEKLRETVFYVKRVGISIN